MRALIVPLVVVGSVLVTRPLVAAPPDDLPGYCRGAYGPVQYQVRCLYTERAAQDRVARTRAAVTPDGWARCEGSSGSWAAMESCLGARGGATTSAAGAAGRSGGDEGGESRPDQTGDAAPGGSGTAAAPTPAGSPVVPPTASAPTPSTVILGPHGSAASTATESTRATRPVTEAEAERHLKGVLERTGESAARCTKKQYGSGWVTVCE